VAGAVAVPYIGRAQHRAAVAAAFAEPGHVLLIRGEAGVGKSSLIATERAGATTDVVEGACLQLAGQPLALAALEQLFDARGGWPEPEEAPEQQSAEQRLRAIRRWADALAPAGATTPTTLVVEDLQWADETTCDFLVYLASTAARRRLSLVLTLRDDETPRVARVQQASADLARLPGAQDIELHRLGLEESRELVAALTGSAEVDVDTWYRRTQGNPYLLGELVRDPGARRVKDVLLARVHALGPDATELVRLAAVFGLWVADADLHSASVLPPERYAPAVREAVDVGVLVVEGADYAFRHSLMCEAVLAQMLPIERRSLHERAARALGGRSADDVVTAVAVSVHWEAAGMPGRAAEWCLRAARKARALNAFAEAWGHYQRALEFGRYERGPEHLQLVLEAAGAARLGGDPAVAAALIEETLRTDPAEESVRAAALERLGCFLWEAGRTTRSLAAYAAAAEALGSEMTAVHAQVWGAQARAALIMAEFDEAVRLADQAVEAARERGTSAVLADALTTRGTAGALLGDVAALAVLREGVALARDVEDRGVLCRGYANLMVAYEVSGMPGEAVAAALEGLRLLPEYGLELAVGAALACNAANMLIRRGHYARCEEVLAGLLDGRVVQGQGLHLHLERAELQLRMGNPAGARASLEAAAPLRDVDEPAVVAAVATATAELLAQEGDRDGCYRIVDQALRRLASTQDHVFRAELLVIGLRNEADRAGPVPGRSDPATAARIERLAAELDRLPAAAPDDVSEAAHQRTAHNELARVRGCSSPEDWADAVRLWQAAEHPREEAYSLLRQTECHVAAKQRDKAAAAAWAARAIAVGIGAAPIVADVDALLARTRLSTAPAPREPREDRPYGLTEREYEVLQQLGSGATNRQIARELFISERTVGVHVSRVLHKLQVTNRAQAAAVAVRVSR
jgi:DNA-binding CsgD family transcriptional regulator/tetratricopeptide (TPR) repeat protein